MLFRVVYRRNGNVVVSALMGAEVAASYARAVGGSLEPVESEAQAASVVRLPAAPEDRPAPKRDPWSLRAHHSVRGRLESAYQVAEWGHSAPPGSRR